MSDILGAWLFRPSGARLSWTRQRIGIFSARATRLSSLDVADTCSYVVRPFLWVIRPR